MLATQTESNGTSNPLLFLVGVVLGGLLAVGAGWLERGDGVATTGSVEGVAFEPASRSGASGELEPAAEAQSGERTLVIEGLGVIEASFGILGMGRVTDSEGAPIESATVALALASGQLLEATTSKTGAWSLVDLEPGEVHVAIKAEGFVALEEDAEIAAAQTWRGDWALTRGMQLPVRFVDPEGQPVKVAALAFSGAGLSTKLGVVATAQAPGRHVYGVNSGRALRSPLGRYLPVGWSSAGLKLGPEHQGLLRVAARPPVWVALTFGSLVVERRQLMDVPTELVFAVDVAALGERLGDLRVRVVGKDGTQLSVAPTSPSPFREDSTEYEGGQMILRNRPPGRAVLVVGGGEWEELRLHYFMPIDADLDLGTLVLGRAMDLEFRVVDERGAPLETEALAARVGRFDFPWLLTFERGFRSDPGGHVRLPGMARGPTMILAGGRAGHARVGRLVDTSSGTIADIVVPRGVPVRFQRGSGLLPGSRCVIEDAQGRPIYADYWLPGHLTLQPGDYAIRIGTQDGEVSRIEFHVQGSGLVVRYGEKS